jgi:hypothetical protein
MARPTKPQRESLGSWLRRQVDRTDAPAPPRRAVKSFVRLEDVILRSPRTFGYDVCAWTPALVRDYLMRELGLPISEDEVARRLKAVRTAMPRAEQSVPREQQRSAAWCAALSQTVPSHAVVALA